MIRVENLTKYYDGFCAVDHINLSIQKGEIVGLLGPNGAGKTTTLRMLTGYLSPSSGTIQVKEYHIDKDPIRIKQLMGYLPESAPLYQGMLVFDFLNFIAGVRGIDGKIREDRIRHLSDLCGLKDIMHLAVSELSRGLKQRVGLAHAMMTDPEILILDEPTSGLDPNQIVEIRDIIRRAGKKKTIILSTHILSEAEATCDRVIIISRGKIVADDDTKSLKQLAGAEQSLKVTLKNADAGKAKELFESINGISTVLSIEDPAADIISFRLTSREDQDLRQAVYEAVKKTDWILMEMVKETRNLETVFRELTREL
ncbi:MAG: ATP-binding cassette domain-containing protein [Thermodesulfobacteriota bacterium]